MPRSARGAPTQSWSPRPQDLAADVPFILTAILDLEPLGAGTRYSATVLHSNEAGRIQHEAVGFYHG